MNYLKLTLILFSFVIYVRAENKTSNYKHVDTMSSIIPKVKMKIDSSSIGIIKTEVDNEFERWYQHMVKNEGGYDISRDENRGITWATYKSLANKYELDSSKTAFLNMKDAEHRKFAFHFWKECLVDKIKHKPFRMVVVQSVWASPAYWIVKMKQLINIHFNKKLKINSQINLEFINTLNEIDNNQLFKYLDEHHEIWLLQMEKTDNKKFVIGWRNRFAEFKKIYYQN